MARRSLAASGERLATEMLDKEAAKLRGIMAGKDASVEAVEAELRRWAARGGEGCWWQQPGWPCTCGGVQSHADAGQCAPDAQGRQGRQERRRSLANLGRAARCRRFLDEYDLKVHSGPFKYKKAAEFLMNTIIIGIKGIVQDILRARDAASAKATAAEATVAQVTGQCSALMWLQQCTGGVAASH